MSSNPLYTECDQPLFTDDVVDRDIYTLHIAMKNLTSNCYCFQMTNVSIGYHLGGLP